MEAKIKEAIKQARSEKPGVVLSSNDIYSAIFKAGYKEGLAHIHQWKELVCPKCKSTNIHTGGHGCDSLCWCRDCDHQWDKEIKHSENRGG